MGCAWFGPSLSAETKKPSHERRSLTWRATGVVSLRDEGLQVIPRVAYEQGGLIKALDASNNQIEELDDGISAFHKIQRITLSNNRIKLLNERILTLSKLRVLVRKKEEENTLLWAFALSDTSTQTTFGGWSET